MANSPPEDDTDEGDPGDSLDSNDYYTGPQQKQPQYNQEEQQPQYSPQEQQSQFAQQHNVPPPPSSFHQYSDQVADVEIDFLEIQNVSNITMAMAPPEEQEIKDTVGGIVLCENPLGDLCDGLRTPPRNENPSAFFLYTVVQKEKNVDHGDPVVDGLEHAMHAAVREEELCVGVGQDGLLGHLQHIGRDGAKVGRVKLDDDSLLESGEGGQEGVHAVLGDDLGVEVSEEAMDQSFAETRGEVDINFASNNHLNVEGSALSRDCIDGFMILSSSSYSVLQDLDRSECSMSVKDNQNRSSKNDKDGEGMRDDPSAESKDDKPAVDKHDVVHVIKEQVLPDNWDVSKIKIKKEEPGDVNVQIKTGDKKKNRRKTGFLNYEKCPIEIKRDKIVAERNELFRQTFEDIKQIKNELIEGNKVVKKPKGRLRKKSVDEINLEAPRRSARDRKPVESYGDKYDDEWKPSRRCAKKTNLDEKNLITVNSLRSNQKVDYKTQLINEDDKIFCERCQMDKYLGCEIHPVIFDYKPEVVLGVSKVGRNAGRGVFNSGSESIPEGALMGPYIGIFYSKEEHALLNEINGESGYAWQLFDSDKLEVIGFIDPGPDPDPELNPLAFVNCAATRHVQNLVAVQFQGKMYYHALKAIPPGSEFLVYYGDPYAKSLSIKTEERELFKGRENWTEAGINCPHCGILFVNEECLREHLSKSGTAGCVELQRKKNKEDVLSEKKAFVCPVCSLGFSTKSDLKSHEKSHREGKHYNCSQCDKAFRGRQGLRQHVDRVHLGILFSCNDCESKFTSRSGMKYHWRAEHSGEEKPIKCEQCGVKFWLVSELNVHVRCVHDVVMPFVCDQCGTRFARKYGLKYHVNSVHKKLKPFKCNECSESFPFKQPLDKHIIRKHSFQWPYTCELCQVNDKKKGFLIPKAYEKHMKDTHPEVYEKQLREDTPEICSKCKKRFPTKEELLIHREKMH